MPTYKFKCLKCGCTWEERQSMLFNGGKHIANCSECAEEGVESIPSGGTGTLLKGRNMDKYLEGFPDFTLNKNKEAEKEGEELNKKHDKYIKEKTGEDERR